MEQFTRIERDESLMELVRHGSDDFPFEYYYERIEAFENGSIDGHWHREFEFVSVAEGEALCFLGHQKIRLGKGEGLLVNSGVIHGFSTPGSGVIDNILFSPVFLAPENARIYQRYVRPFLESDLSYMILREDGGWQSEVLAGLNHIYRLCHTDAPRTETWEMEVYALLCGLWPAVYRNRKAGVTVEKTGTTRLAQARLKQMTQFIEKHYAEELSLERIARAASVSKSEALRCFRDGVRLSPVRYLNRYRLRQAQRLLLATSRPVTEIAVSVGFDNVGYFDRLFKREYGVTPRLYRMHHPGADDMPPLPVSQP